jgi:hypothetical protein
MLTSNEWSYVVDALKFQMSTLFENENMSNIERLFALRLGEIADKIEKGVTNAIKQ